MEYNEIYHVISNTHWDREWYQSHEKYLDRLVELCDRLVGLLEEKKDYRFISDGQYAMIGDYIEAKPENRDRVAALVKEGRLLVGPWYTQPLEGLVGGEALCRNLEYGIRSSEKLGGVMKFAYEIDEFGHTAQMPQILSGFGIPSAMAWRGLPKKSKSVVRWEAPDGSAVDMFYSRSGYGEATALPLCADDYTEVIDGVEIPRAGLKNKVAKLRELRLFNSDSRHMLWLNGIDHSWAQEDLFEAIGAIKELFPEIEVVQSTPEEYAAAVLADYKEKGITPAPVRGELMYNAEDVLESTNALHPRQKQRHFRSEHAIVNRLEPVSALAWTLGRKHPSWAIDRAWKNVLENHAHDSLGCCSVDEVFEQVMARYGASLSLSEQVTDDGFRYIMSCGTEAPSLWIFNTAQTPVSGVRKLTFDVPSGFGNGTFLLNEADGTPVPVKILSVKASGDIRYNPRLGHPTNGTKSVVTALIDLPEIPAFGWLRLDFAAGDPAVYKLENRKDSVLFSRPDCMENEYLSVRFLPNGTFDLTDKSTGYTYRSQLLFEDSGEAGDVYIHAEPKFDRRTVYSVCGNASFTQVFDTPLGAEAEIALTLSVPDGITADRRQRGNGYAQIGLTVRVFLGKNSKKLDLKIGIENGAVNHRLRVLFPTGLINAEKSFGMQAFDLTERDIVSAYDPEARHEQIYQTKPMLGFCGVTDGKNGLAVTAPGIYEYEVIDDADRAVAVTLLRSIDVISAGVFATVDEYRMKEALNLTKLSFELSLIPFAGEKENVIAEALSSLEPPRAMMNRQTEDSVMPGYRRPENVMSDHGAFLESDNGRIVIASVRKQNGGNGIAADLCNPSDREETVRVRLGVPGIHVKETVLCDLAGKEKAVLGEGNGAELRIAPHQVLSVLFRL